VFRVPTRKATLRKAIPADLHRIFELLAQANMHHIPSAEMPCLTFENYWVAETNSGVMGFCGYQILTPVRAKTELMVVDTASRGDGLGLMLQTHRMQQMFDQGIIYLTTNTDSPASIAWYQKHFSYKQVGQLKKLHEFGDPLIDSWTTLEVHLKDWKNSLLEQDNKRI
jgi:N-acetylglutamate synthase-like GNAT family acetyltransferase